MIRPVVDQGTFPLNPPSVGVSSLRYAYTTWHTGHRLVTQDGPSHNYFSKHICCLLLVACASILVFKYSPRRLCCIRMPQANANKRKDWLRSVLEAVDAFIWFPSYCNCTACCLRPCFVGGVGYITTLSQEAAAHSWPVAQHGRDKLRAVAWIM